MFDYFLLLGFFFGLVVVLLLVLHDLKWGVYLIPAILPTYLLRAQITWIPTTFLELALYLVVLVALAKLFRILWKNHFKKQVFLKIIKDFWRKGKWIHIFTLVILITSVIGTIVSADKRLSLGILKGFIFDPLIYFYLVIFILDKLADFKKIFYLAIVPGIILAIYGIYQYFTGDLASDERVRGVFESPNYVSLYFGPLLIIILGLIIDKIFREKGKWQIKRIIAALGLCFSFILMGVVLFLTKSYAAWLAVLVGVLVLLLLIPRRKWLYYLLFLGISLLGIATQWNNPKLKAVFDFVGGTSMHKRLEIWQVSFSLIKNHWFGGIGLGRFPEVYRENVLGVLQKTPLDWIVLHSHNLFLMFWLNLGILGFLSFLGVIIWFFYSLAKLAKNKNFFTKIKLEYFIFLGIFITILVHGLLDTPYWKNDLALIFWFVVGGVLWLRNWQSTRR